MPSIKYIYLENSKIIVESMTTIPFTKARKREKEAERGAVSQKINGAVDQIPILVNKIIDEYEKIRNLPGGKKIDSKAYDVMRDISLRLSAAARSSQTDSITRDAEVRMEYVRGEYSLTNEDFKSAFDQEVKKTRNDIKAADSVIDNLGEILSNLQTVSRKVSRRQYSSFRAGADALDINPKIIVLREKGKDTIRIAISAVSPESLANSTNRNVEYIDVEEIISIYALLKTDELVVRRIGKIAKALKNGKPDIARSILDGSTGEAFRAEMEGGAESLRHGFAEGPGRQAQQQTTAQIPAIERREVHATGTVSATWIEHAKDYYSNFRPELDETERRKVEESLARLDRSNSMKDAIELWKTINVIWVRKTDVLDDEQSRGRFVIHTNGVEDLDGATLISRKLLVKHAYRYGSELAKGIIGTKEGAEAIRESTGYTDLMAGLSKKGRQKFEPSILYNFLNAIKERELEDDFLRSDEAFIWRNIYDTYYEAYLMCMIKRKRQARDVEPIITQPPLNAPFKDEMAAAGNNIPTAKENVKPTIPPLVAPAKRSATRKAGSSKIKGHDVSIGPETAQKPAENAVPTVDVAAGNGRKAAAAPFDISDKQINDPEARKGLLSSIDALLRRAGAFPVEIDKAKYIAERLNPTDDERRKYVLPGIKHLKNSGHVDEVDKAIRLFNVTTDERKEFNL